MYMFVCVCTCCKYSSMCLCVLWGQRFRIFVIIPPTTTTSMMEEKPPSLPLTCTTHNTQHKLDYTQHTLLFEVMRTR
jgi:hypothetical protein